MNRFFRSTLYMTGTRRSVLDIARGRLVLVSAAFALVYIIVAARVMDLAILQGELRAAQETSAYEQADPAALVRRADITDRNGVLLARSLQTASLYADPALIADPESAAKALAGVFPDMAYGELLKKLQGEGRFVWLRRNLTPEEQYKVLYLGQPGLNFREEDRRIYPQGPLTAHMVGYAGIDGHGLAGIEAGFDKLLREGGKPLALTLDVRLQHALRREMMEAVKAHRAAGAAGVIMDVGTGEVLAAVSLPDYDPHEFGQADSATFNRVTLGVYEPGSIFKIFTTAAYLEARGDALGNSFDATEPLKYGRFTISDYHPEKRPLSVAEIFIHSSNIGTALMGQDIGGERLEGFFGDLGLLDPVSFEVPEIGVPLVPKPWREVSTLTAAYGHGIAVTPLQLVSAAASVFNGGLSVQPTLILDQFGQDKAAKRSETRIISPQTAHRMRQLMRLAVTDGTGENADVPGLNVGGKTGTAEKSGVGGYEKNKLLSSFLGVFPMNAPRYAVLVMIDEPKGLPSTYGYATGGWVAAPVAGRVMESMASVLGLEPQKNAEDLTGSLRRYVKTEAEIKELRHVESH